MHTKDAIKFALTVSNGAVLSRCRSNEIGDAPTTFSDDQRRVPPRSGSWAISR